MLVCIGRLYPLVTHMAFEGFPCYTFEGGRAWLMADVSIECGTDEHAGVLMLAWVAVVVYPKGIMLFCASLLFCASSAILDGKATPLSHAIDFLHRECALGSEHLYVAAAAALLRAKPYVHVPS